MTHKNASEPKAGTSGLVLPAPNKQAFPAEFRAGTRLTYYASLFNSIELNSSFYKVPMPATFSRWADEVPDHFEFTVKLWRGITHAAGLRFSPEDVNRCLYAAHHLGEKKGCLLIQLPPGLKAEAAPQLGRLLETVRQADPGRTWKLAVEFRHPSWYSPAINELLYRYQASRVLHDMPASAISELPAQDNAPSFVYLRFHGPAGDYKGGYAENILRYWAKQTQEWLSAGNEVYIYFNNTIGDALADLNKLQMLISNPSTAGAVQ